ncbi:hypothetical protein E4U19_002179 [Claviceps sp. Clav32 group G5]|nr:hypothetical protein E4U19_002179 [Claviceps sp. Clav32 group G5]
MSRRTPSSSGPSKESSAEPLERRLTTPASSRYYERLAAEPAGRATWVECPCSSCYLNVEVDLPYQTLSGCLMKLQEC